LQAAAALAKAQAEIEPTKAKKEAGCDGGLVPAPLKSTSAFFLLPLSKTDAQAAAVLVDEDQASTFHRAANLFSSLLPTSNPAVDGFQPSDRRLGYFGATGQLTLGPTEQCTASLHLLSRNQ
jgi:hypothetical protein